jgi:hypothetical protein
MSAMRRLLPLTAAVLLSALLTAPAAMAQMSGEGTYGEVNDKIVTNAGFILIAFFPAFILVASLIQWQLDKRKARRKAAEKGRGANPHWNTGW